MLDVADRLVLPDGVRVEGDTVVDEVRGVAFPANATALAVLERRGEPLAVAVDELRARWELPPDRARADVLAFAWFLVHALLVNVDPGRSRLRRQGAWLALALRLLPTGRFPAPVPRRARLDTRSAWRACASTIRALAARASLLAVVVGTLVLHVYLVAGRGSLREPLVLGCATGLGLLLHEAAHAAALVGVPSALVLSGGRTSVLHRRLSEPRARLVAGIGPLLPTMLAVALATLALAAESPVASLAACGLGGHALAATVACRDGRAACGL